MSLSLNEGEVFRSHPDPTCYVLEDGARRRIPDEDTLYIRYSDDMVKWLSQEEVDAVPRGPDYPSIRSYTPPSGPIGSAIQAALYGPEKKKLKVRDHEFNVKPMEISRNSGVTAAYGHISHHLSWRPDDQVHYEIVKERGVVKKIEMRINRGGLAPIAAPIVSALGAYFGGVAIPPDKVEAVARGLGAAVEGRWETVAEFLIAHIAIDPRL
jgi:hypothetical protein